MDEAGTHLPAGERGEVVIKGPNVITRLREQSRGQRHVVRRRLVPHRRSGLPRRRRLPDARRPHQGADQPRRREDLAARDRRSAARASGGRRSGLLRRAASDVGRRSRGRRRRCASRRPKPTCSRTARSGWPTSSGRSRFTSPRRFRARRPARFSARVVAEAYRAESVVRIVIAGAGAIGGYIGARLAQAGRRRRAVRARSASARDAGARAARHQPRRRLRGAGRRSTGDLAAIGAADVVFLGVKAHGLTALAPQLRPLLRARHRRRQHAERHPVVVFPELSAASSTGCGSSASIRAASSPRRSSRGASSDRSRTSRPTSSSRASFTTPKAIASASASRTARKSERAADDRRGADRRRLPLSGHARGSATRSG